jgi:hypothetical protein
MWRPCHSRFDKISFESTSFDLHVLTFDLIILPSQFAALLVSSVTTTYVAVVAAASSVAIAQAADTVPAVYDLATAAANASCFPLATCCCCGRCHNCCCCHCSCHSCPLAGPAHHHGHGGRGSVDAAVGAVFVYGGAYMLGNAHVYLYK